MHVNLTSLKILLSYMGTLWHIIVTSESFWSPAPKKQAILNPSYVRIANNQSCREQIKYFVFSILCCIFRTVCSEITLNDSIKVNWKNLLCYGVAYYFCYLVLVSVIIALTHIRGPAKNVEKTMLDHFITDDPLFHSPFLNHPVFFGTFDSLWQTFDLEWF